MPREGASQSQRPDTYDCVCIGKCIGNVSESVLYRLCIRLYRECIISYRPIHCIQSVSYIVSKVAIQVYRVSGSITPFLDRNRVPFLGVESASKALLPARPHVTRSSLGPKKSSPACPNYSRRPELSHERQLDNLEDCGKRYKCPARQPMLRLLSKSALLHAARDRHNQSLRCC